MARVVVVTMASLVLCLGLLAVPAQSYQGCAPQPQCAPPPRTLVTRMVPCVKTEMVAEVQPCTRCIPVQRVGWTTRKVMLKGTPVGQACGQSPCIKCCPQPFCQVVEEKVPYVYYEYKKIPWYNIVYKPVCHQIVLPQTYCVEATPMCGR
jgi:hypothetical protein